MDAVERRVRLYQLANRRVPYLLWFDSLKDLRARQKIEARLGRVRLGNFGNCRAVGDGVLELKIDFGPGYRVYFAQDGRDIVIILCGGDKQSQARDIRDARIYW